MPPKKFLIEILIIFFAMVFVIVTSLFIFSISPLSAFLFFLGSIVLYSIVGIKYGRYFYEEIPIYDIQSGLLIIHAWSNKTRLTISAIFIPVLAALLAYIGIFIVNLIRQ